jgi:fibronectin-binding autotransporter adhesin
VLAFAGTLRAQFVFNEDFTGTSLNGTWDLAGTGYTPVLTAAQGIDASGSGWLRMTDNQGAEATYARLTTPIPSASNNIAVDLKYQMWTPNATGADGFTISLRDASVPFDVGAYGGSLGYAQKNAAAPGGADTTHAGMAGGYFSVGVDAYGNFSNPTEGRQGGPGQTANSVAVRGPGSGTGTTYSYTDANGNLVTVPNYNYLGGTTNLAGGSYNLGNINFTGVNSRPVDSSAASSREIVFNFTTDNTLTVSMRFGATGTLTQVVSTNLTSLGIRPENLELVFTAGTGGLMQYTEIQGLSISTSGAPVGTVYYSNYAGDNKWGNGNNWGNSSTPNLGSVPLGNASLVFSNHAFTAPSFQLTTAQTVDLGQNRSAASIQFDAPFNYTLQGYNLTLGSGSVGVPTAITVTSAAPGGAHTIESAITLGSDLNINTNTGTALNLSGAIAAGTHTITLNNNGTTTVAGAITGSGTMTQTATATGTTVISGDSSSTYTGDIVVQNGTIRLGNNGVLNAATNVSLSTANSTGTFDLAGHNQALGNITFVSGGTLQSGSGTLSLNGSVSSQASATAATISGNLNLGNATRTFSVADGGVTPDMVVTANVTGSGGINKTGNGSLQLSGLNTFSGTNTFGAGTAIAASDQALGTGASTIGNGATLGLQGGIALNSGTITVSGAGYTGSNGAIDNRSSDNTLVSNVTLAGNTTVGAASGTELTLSGAVGQSTASQLTIGGSGTVVLAGNNSYTGSTVVNSGATLVAASNNAMGTNAAGTTVNSGATLGFQGGITYTTAEPVTVSGTGVAGRNGALDNVADNNTFAGNVALAGATTIGAAAGTNLTLSGAVSGANAVTIGGTGSITFSGNNSYTGTTTVASGATLIAANNNALGNTGANTASTVSNGGTLGVQGGVAIANENISITGTGVGGAGALMNVSGDNSISNQITLTGNSTVSAAAGSTLTLAGGLSDGASTYSLTKSDNGTVVIGGAGNYNGTTTITGGTLAFANAGTLGSTANITVTNGTLALDNSTANNANRIANTAGIALNDGTLRFIGNGAAASTETLGNVTATTGANTVYLQTTSTGHADLTISNLIQNGSSTITFATDPTVTLGAGATSAGQGGSPRAFLTQINGVATGGTLAAPTALAGWILVNDINGSANFAEYTGNSGTGNGVRALTSYYTGALGINVNDATKSVLLTSTSPAGAYTLTNAGTTTDANLKITDATIVDLGGSNTRTLRLNSGGLIKSGATTTTISGSGNLSSGNNGTLAITVDSVGGVLNISAPIVNNGTTSLTKSGAGLLSLTGANTFSGNVNLNDGILRIVAENGLGATNVTRTIALNGGVLNVGGTFTTNTRKTWAIGANSSGTFDIDANQALTLPGTGDLTGGTTSTLIKAGAGALVLSAANTGFTGSTIVNSGTLELDNANALGTNRPLTLNGGNLRLENNTATTYATNITVTADSSITVDRATSGSNLTHGAGTLAIGNATLTIAGGNLFDLRLGNVTTTGDAVLNTNTAGTDLTVGSISGAGGITKSGVANMTITAASTYAGATSVTGGTLYTQGTNFLPTTTALTIADGATVDTGNGSQTLASLAGGTGTATFNLGTGSLTVGDDTTKSFGGTITANAFTKNGSGTLTLGGGASNAIANFAINDGTVVAAKSGGDATGSGPVTIGDSSGPANSAVLQLAAANQINDGSAVTINSDGRLDLAGYNETIGSVAGSGSVNLGAGQLTLAGNASTAFSGSISGTGGVTKNGNGTLQLSGTSSYSGATQINQGTVQISNSSAFGSGAGGVTVANNSGLELQSNIAVNGAALTITGTGANGNGALRNISGDNTWSGAVSLGGNATVNVTAGNLYLSGGINTGGNALTVSGSGNTQATGAIVGSGSVVKSGIGALVLNAVNNNYTGTTTINGGSLQIDVDNAGPASSAVNLAATATTLNINNHTTTVGSLAGVDGSNVVLGSGALAAGATNATTTYAGTISGSGSFTKTGTGTLTLSGTGANSLSGNFNVSDGTVVLSKSGALDATGSGALQIGDGTGSAASAAVLVAGANQINDAVAVTINADGRLNLNSNSEAIGSLAGAAGSSVTLGTATLTAGGNNASTTYSGAISGTGGLTKAGSGTLALNGASTYTGATNITGGTLELAATNAISASTTLTISSGAKVALDGGLTQTVAGLTTAGTSSIDIGSNAKLTVNSSSASTLLGSLTGTGALAYTGGGNVTIGNNLSFSGTLSFGGTTIGGTPTTTLYLANSVMLGTLHITGDTILDFGNSTATTLNATNLIIDSGVKVTVVNWVNLSDYFVSSNFVGAVIDQRGNTPIPNNATTQVTFNGFSNDQTNWQSWDHEITPAPEPATYGAIFVGAALGFAGFFRRRTRRRVR